MEKDYVIAVDQGNKLIKTAPFGNIFSAGIRDHRDSVPLTVKNIDLLRYEGNYYTVDSQHIPDCANKAEEKRYLILTLMAIGKELMRAEKEERHMREDESFPENYEIAASIVLALGLPPGDYNRFKDDYKRAFCNGLIPYRYTFNGVNFNVVVTNVLVFPQGFAAIAANKESMQLLREANISVIDIGGYTTDVCTLSRGVLENYRTFQRLGMNGLYAAINVSVQNKYGESLRDDQIDEILNPLCRSSQVADVQETVKAATATYANDLINRLREEGIQIKLSIPVFIGGGALRLRPYIERIKDMHEPVWVEDICANAHGFYELARSQLKASHRGGLQ